MASIKVKLRKSTVKGKPGTVFYQICHASLCGQITTNLHIPEENWDSENGEIRSTDPETDDNQLQMSRLKIESDIKHLQRIIRNLESRNVSYDISDIKRMYDSTSSSRITVFYYMDMHIKRLVRNKHYGTAKNYQCALNSFSDFLCHNDIPLGLLNEGLILEYNDYLEDKGLKRNSISFYMRIWRAVYNRAVREKIIEQEFPFQNVYTGIDHTRKRAVSEDTILKLMKLDLKHHSNLELSRDLFIFSYCTRGMAFVDIAFLKKSNIEEERIVYRRRKTSQLMIVRIEPCIRYLIEKYAASTLKSEYVFPILTTHDDSDTYRQYMTALSFHNIKLKKLSELAGLCTTLTSYTPRHSWATIARNHQVPISVISAGMGHTSEKTTEIYLASLENSVIDDVNKLLLEKLNKQFSF